MEHIKYSINKVIQDLQKNQEPFIIEDVWNKVVDEKIKLKTKFIRLHNKKLYVYFEESTWVYELKQKYKRSFLEKIKKEIGDDNISDIEFRIG